MEGTTGSGSTYALARAHTCCLLFAKCAKQGVPLSLIKPVVKFTQMIVKLLSKREREKGEERKKSSWRSERV